MSAHGFALAELVVVLAVVGTLTGLVAPALSGYASTAALEATARQLATSINLGRQLAISRNTTVCVEVISLRDVRLLTGGCGGAIWTGVGTDDSGAIAIANSAPLRLSSTANVVFTSLGAASPAGTYILTNPASGMTRSVVVAATGRVSVR